MWVPSCNVDYFSTLAGYRLTGNEKLELLERAGLPREDARRRASQYSKGMRQKVGIAIALAKNETAILMDEPTSGLDPQASNEFSQLVKMLDAEDQLPAFLSPTSICPRKSSKLRTTALVVHKQLLKAPHDDRLRLSF